MPRPQHNRRCDSSDTSGELRFDYLLWIKYDPKTARPIEGKCINPLPAAQEISPVRAAWSPARRPLGHEKILTYQGEIVLNVVDNEPVTFGQGSADGFVVPRAPAVGC